MATKKREPRERLKFTVVEDLGAPHSDLAILPLQLGGLYPAIDDIFIALNPRANNKAQAQKIADFLNEHIESLECFVLPTHAAYDHRPGEH